MDISTVERLTTYKAKRGATEYLDIEAFTGTPDGTEITRAALKVAHLDKEVPADDVEVSRDFAIQFVPAAGAVKAYWRLTLTAEQTETLAPDIYITDVRIVQGGVVTYSDPVLIDFRERVTPPLA